ncbi:MAG: 16S rRNA (guanine(527)-N(7))-methyltransferase RsmG [Roseburia sp.]|nr:16S rRNA (guanine(527)-N(7))-methyltransferase RsmG [Roseburia sp.]MCM1278776.1 16S rRNA (guanine(527)-N(7))-methyltransferase RsmG [Robinsoniella sp.]
MSNNNINYINNNINYNISEFQSNLEELGIFLSDKQMEQFIAYYELLTEWNSFMNLTAITDFDQVIKKHFLDSLSLVKAYDLSKEIKVIDIGTGAGFPGIPLKIAFPHLEVTLLDSLNKRVKFLNEVKERLALTNLEILHGRAEDFAKPEKLREKYDLCVSRAVANLSTLSELCLPYVKVGGRFISYKSEKIKEESIAAKKAIKILGGEVEKQVEFTFSDEKLYRNLFVIKKINPTPKIYPRRAGLPAKEPI